MSMLKRFYALCAAAFGLVLSITPNNVVKPIFASKNNLNNAVLSDCVITDISAGTDHNLALDQNGNLWAWGNNGSGQLGDGTTVNSYIPKQIMKGHKFKKISAGNNCSAAIDIDGYLYGWGSNINPTKQQSTTPTLVSSIDKYKDVLCGYDFTATSKAQDTTIDYYYGYGYFNSYTYSTRRTHYISNENYPAIKDNNYRKEDRSQGNPTFNVLNDKIVDADGNFYFFYSDYSYEYYAYYWDLFYITSSGELTYLNRSEKGYNNNSISSNEPRVYFENLDLSIFDDIFLKKVSTRKVIESSSTMYSSAYFVDEEGLVYSVGYNGLFGLLGQGDSTTISSNLPELIPGLTNIVDVSAGKDHVLALTDDGKIYSWGNNAYGQLGSGDTSNRTVPTKIVSLDRTKNFSITGFKGDSVSGDLSQYGGSNYRVIEAPSKGTLTVDNASGSFEYSAASNESGEAKAVISIDYSGETVNYDVNIYIDSKPVFVGGNSSFNVECGKSFNGTAPAIDADGDVLTYSIYEGPSKGNVVLNNNAGSFTYTASDDMAGGDSFIIAVSDGYCTVQYPVIVHVQSLISYSDTTDKSIDLLVTDTINGNVNAIDADGDTLNYSIKKNGSKGTVTIDDEGNYAYVANGNSYGEDTFIVKVDDGYKPLEITYAVHLYSVSDNGTTLAAKITKGTSYNGEIKTNANGVAPTYSIQSQPANGNVSIDAATGEYSYTPNVGSVGDDSFVALVDYVYGQYTLTIHVYQNTIPNNSLVNTEVTTPLNTNYNGTAECMDSDGDLLTYTVKTQPLKGSLSLNPTTGSYIYYPNQNVAGDDSFEINVNDGTDIITNLINIHIESEIDVDALINRTISQNTSLSANVNALDKDGDTLVYSISKNADHGIANIDSLTGDYIYIPNTNYYGVDTFIITVDDGVLSKTVTVNVNVNRRPIANNISIHLETEGLTITGTAACSDPDGDTLTYSVFSQPSQGTVIVNSSNGGFAYTPNADAHGDDSFQIQATDGCDDIIVNVIVHNETAVVLGQQETTLVVNQGRSTTGQVIAVDLDGDTLTYSVLNYPTQGTVNLNSSTGAWTYNARSNASGRDSFKVQVTDGNTNVVLEYSLVINTPAAFGEESYSFVTNQNSNYTGTVHATDADGDSLTYSIISQGNKGTATVDSLTGRYQYAPNAGESGNDTFVIGVTDGNFTTEVVVNVHIESDITVPNGTITIETTPNEIVTGNVNATDPDGDQLTYTITNQGQKGTANVMGNGNFSYYASAEAGRDSFIISITDGTHTTYVTVYVNISTDPYFEESSITIAVPKSGSTKGQVHGIDPDGDTLSYSIYRQPEYGTVNLNTITGEYTYISLSNSADSTDSFYISVTDGKSERYIRVNVVINNAPSSGDHGFYVDQGGSYSSEIHATDAENDALTYEIVSQPAHGAVSINSSTGEYTYTTTDKSFSGADHFMVSISDGYSTIIITVKVSVEENEKPKSSGTTIDVSSNSTVQGKLNVTDPEGDSLTYSITSQGDKGTAVIDENTGEFTYYAKPDTNGSDCFVVTVSDGFNTVSFLVEVNITFVDSNVSWAIPTTIATGSTTVLALAGLVVVLIIAKKKKA